MARRLPGLRNLTTSNTPAINQLSPSAQAGYTPQSDLKYHLLKSLRAAQFL
jgi:hypothetical protein